MVIRYDDIPLDPNYPWAVGGMDDQRTGRRVL